MSSMISVGSRGQKKLPPLKKNYKKLWALVDIFRLVYEAYCKFKKFKIISEKINFAIVRSSFGT
jgi:hypothetical protein